MARRERVGHGEVDERRRRRVGDRRTVTLDPLLQRARDALRDQDRDGDARPEPGPAPGEARDRDRDREPDEAERAGVRERLEQRVQHADAGCSTTQSLSSRSRPPTRGSETGSCCLVDSISERGSNGLPMKPCDAARRSLGRRLLVDLARNMITGIAPTPCAPGPGAASPSRRPAASSRRAGSGRATPRSSASSPSSALPASRTS